MAQFVKYKFDDHTDMYVIITQFTMCNSPSNPMSNLKANLEKIKSFPAQVKSLPDDLDKVKSIQNSMYDMVHKRKDRIS